MADFTSRDLLEGLNGLLGFRITEWREGYAEIAVDLDDRHRNRQGGLHGGTTAALIDAATGFCGIYERDPEKRRGNRQPRLPVDRDRIAVVREPGEQPSRLGARLSWRGCN